MFSQFCTADPTILSPFTGTETEVQTCLALHTSLWGVELSEGVVRPALGRETSVRPSLSSPSSAVSSKGHKIISVPAACLPAGQDLTPEEEVPELALGHTRLLGTSFSDASMGPALLSPQLSR